MADAQSQTALSALRIDRSAAPMKRRRRLRWLIPVGLLVAVLVLVAGAVTRRAPTVRVAEVREPLPGEQQTELSASGYVDSRRRSVIAPLVAGQLVEVAVEEGEPVRRGQVIARLDDRDARVVLDRAEAAVRASEAQLASSEAQALNAQRTTQRTRNLARQGVVPRAQLLDVETAGRATQEALNLARAQLAVARRASEAARLQLSHTVVRAPFDGTVSKKLANEGAVLAPAALTGTNLGGIVELVDLHALEVEAEVSEEQLSRIRIGQPALIFLDALPGRAFPGQVATVRPAIDRSKATATVLVRFQSVPQGALPDMGSKVSFLRQPLPPGQLAAHGQPPRVPASAVVRDAKGTAVWVVKDGQLARQPVRVGERVGDEVSLTQGPGAGTQVVVAPDPKRLHDGRRVKVEAGSG
ncbi:MULTISPECIES: efflux RND transporter periplasmic adaptor subunit [unclassified Corallococcus]|uniref:efflux RND transporter periplasmic adaptor subunit n=1 Tax=unclassified Corallococcus TaxID=2685029 RepID=UPI001A8FDE12|nr:MULTISPECIES: efflux RND transporter periplasmic adaptor subunit [unclassified Corallococcus]MBN9685543.1 efflux RND transporter periplasmic adaptor subunit [Corallococcus sp. NCSPR001]WAS83009.1 efflux RND transporter periplasmic adaptor subunit [Corallococcus sp. NCRR]